MWRVFQGRENNQAKTLSLEGAWFIEWASEHQQNKWIEEKETYDKRRRWGLDSQMVWGKEYG